MIKFNFTAADVKALRDREGLSYFDAKRQMEKQFLLEEIEESKENKDPGRLADVVKYLVERL